MIEFRVDLTRREMLDSLSFLSETKQRRSLRIFFYILSGLFAAAAIRMVVIRSPAAPRYIVLLLILLCIIPFTLRSVQSRINLAASVRRGIVSDPVKPFLCSISHTGIATVFNGIPHALYSYHAISDVVQTDKYLLVRLTGKTILSFPLRCFPSSEAAAEALQIITDGLHRARAGQTPPLPYDEQPCLWRFYYTLDSAMALDTLTLQLKSTQQPFYKKPFFWATVLAGGHFAAAWAITGPGSAYFLFALLLLIVAAAICLRIITLYKNPNNLLPSWLPAYRYGPCMLEISRQGIRTCNAYYRSFYAWPDVSPPLNGPTLANLVRREAFLAPLPYSAGPQQNVAAALEYIRANACNR